MTMHFLNFKLSKMQNNANASNQDVFQKSTGCGVDAWKLWNCARIHLLRLQQCLETHKSQKKKNIQTFPGWVSETRNLSKKHHNESTQQNFTYYIFKTLLSPRSCSFTTKVFFFFLFDGHHLPFVLLSFHFDANVTDVFNRLKNKSLGNGHHTETFGCFSPFVAFL